MKDAIRYDGKRVVITGCATGMGQAAARLVHELGGEVHALDIKPVSGPVKQYIETDLSDPASIDAAVEQIGEPIHALLNCAGLPGPPFSNLETLTVNFIGPRQLVERVTPLMPSGSAIAIIGSAAGMGFLIKIPKILEFIATPDFAAAQAWYEANPDAGDGYSFSKECLIIYAMRSGKPLGERGIRINVISPGITETPMLPRFHANAGKDYMETYFQGHLGRNSQPEEQAWPLVFLASDAASYITGANLYSDAGVSGAIMSGAVPPPPMPARPGAAGGA